MVLEQCWESFHPCGIPITEELKEEVFVEFISWISSLSKGSWHFIQYSYSYLRVCRRLGQSDHTRDQLGISLLGVWASLYHEFDSF